VGTQIGPRRVHGLVAIVAVEGVGNRGDAGNYGNLRGVQVVGITAAIEGFMVKFDAGDDGLQGVVGPENIRAKNGVKLDLNVATRTGTPDIDQQLELLRNDWKQIGVGLNVHRYPTAQMFAPVQQGGIINGDTWDVITFAWAADPLGDYSAIYGCNSFPPEGQNDLRWCNKTAQGAMDALVGHDEQSERIADIKVIMREFIKDVPSIVSFQRVDLFAYNKDLKNYRPNNITPFDNMMDVDI